MSKYLNTATEFEFTGFSPRTLNFLKDLKSNNSKAWFEAHKKDYQSYLPDPLRNLVRYLSKFMLAIDPYLMTIPAINKTISRIYRDTRFSKDKSLFKNVMWITFKRTCKDWKDAPAYFFEISPDFYRYGMGFYSASKSTMDRFREMIDEKPEEFLQVISFYSKQRIFVLENIKRCRIKRNLKKSRTGTGEEIFTWPATEGLTIVFLSPSLRTILFPDSNYWHLFTITSGK